ncbi:MAG: hypothetical protein DCC75_13555 [Proteobacteria bacterium]|nr:MAG: hypothetical protein DCC75_13555 [Pseudomonadota bacterium]
MEYVQGRTLKAHLENGPLSSFEAIKVLLQICEGLVAIHDCEIIHRDLKSTNVMVTPEGEIKITDFGVAKPKSSDLTAHDELVGSATHMAPEAWKQGEISQLTDIYALGVLAYEIVTGVLPFDGNSPHEFMWKHLRLPPVPPIEMNPEIPRWLNNLVLRMLEKNPELRPQTIREIIEETQRKLRRSTVENARKANVLGKSAKEKEEVEEEQLDLTLPEEELEEQQAESEDEEQDFYDDAGRPKKPVKELKPLSQFEFSLQPALIEPEETPSPAPSAPDSTTSLYLRSAFGSAAKLLFIAGTTLALLWGAVQSGDYLSKAWSGLPGAEGLILNSPHAQFTLVASVICLVFTAALPPIVICTFKKTAVSRGVVVIRILSLTLCAWVFLATYNLGRISYWAPNAASNRDLSQRISAAAAAASANLGEITSFNAVGTTYRVVVLGKKVTLTGRSQGGYNRDWVYYLALIALVVCMSAAVLGGSQAWRENKPKVLIVASSLLLAGMIWSHLLPGGASRLGIGWEALQFSFGAHSFFVTALTWLSVAPLVSLLRKSA